MRSIERQATFSSHDGKPARSAAASLRQEQRGTEAIGGRMES